MSESGFTIRLDTETFAALVEAVSERVLERVGETNGGSPWLDTKGAAEYLGGWPVKRVHNLTAAGAIPHRRVGNRLLFHRQELDTWLDRYREGRTC